MPQFVLVFTGVVDERKIMGDFILTGSSQFDLISGISQSLAGRVGRVELLPMSQEELQQANKLPTTLDEALFFGGYPALYDRDVQPKDWLGKLHSHLSRA